MFRLRSLLYGGLVVFGLSVLWAGIFYHRQSQVQALSSTGEWTTITDDYYGYSFQVPSVWHKQPGVTPDRWAFYSDPAVVDAELYPTDLPQGLIKVDFAADPVANWLPDPEQRRSDVDERGMATSEALIPLLPSGTWTKVAGAQALIVREKIDGGPFVEGLSIYVLADQMVYYLWVGYAPPTSANQDTSAQFLVTAEKITAHILETFTIVSK